MTDASLSDTVKSTTTDAADAVADKAAVAADSVKDAASSAADKAGATAKDATATVEKTVDKAAAATEKVVEKSTDGVAKAAGSAAAKATGTVAAGAGGTEGAAKVRTVEEIEADLDATRERLAGRLDDLQEYVAPKNVMNRQVAKVKGVFVDEYGGIKPDRVLIAAGVVAVLVGLRILRHRRRQD